jgi:hypothetical protein
MTDLRAQVEAAVAPFCWSEFAGTGEVLTLVRRDDAINAAMTVFSERLEYMANNTRGRCRWCYVITSEALAGGREPGPHLPNCRFYVGPVEHRVTSGHQMLTHWATDCSCGESWDRERSDACPNSSETWRGPAEGAKP